MLGIAERCGEIPITASSALRPLLKLQKAVLDRYKELTIAEVRSAKKWAELEGMLPLRASAS
ncbi:MAG: hypothetical protein HQL73_14330 [Magnetococcales bacterium]|nr:hypothetical protein [Magnetococcales bacterium]